MLTLRVLSWNIQNGGPSFTEQMALIRAHKPDIAFIQEAKGWLKDGNTLLYRAEHLLGMRPYVAVAKRHDCNLVIFIRPGCGLTVVRDRNVEHWPFWHAQGRLVLDNGLILADCHFAPFSSGIRLEEALASTDLASGSAILAGDFNDDGLPVSLLRATLRQVARMLGRCLPVLRARIARRDQPGHKAVRHFLPGTRRTDTRAAQVLNACGYIDVAAHLAKRFKRHELLAPTAGFKSPSTPRRVDRIYVTPDVNVLDYWVVEQTFSDHHLIMAILSYPGRTRPA